MPRIRIHPKLKDTDPAHFQTYVGMAHFAGTGPIGFTCGECSWMFQRQCLKFKKLTGLKGKPIPEAAEACKYFSDKNVRIRRRKSKKQLPLFDNLPVQRKSDDKQS